MTTVKVIQDTTFKARCASSNTLGDNEKAQVKSGSTVRAVSVAPAGNQHIQIVLEKPLLADDTSTTLPMVYAYGPHVQVDGQQILRLLVDYSSQLNNDPSIFGPGYRQCNTTSNSMLANYLLKGELSQKAKAQNFPEPESVYMRIVAKYGDTTDHDAHTKALAELGIESYFSYSLSAFDLLRSLEAGIPIVAGFAYKRGGHICLVVGRNPLAKQWLIHDPYGIRHGSSDEYDIGANGSFDPYSDETMQSVYWDNGADSGWGRIVTRIKGLSTGLPTGL